MGLLQHRFMQPTPLSQVLGAWTPPDALEFDLEVAGPALSACGEAGVTGTFCAVTSWMTWHVWFVEGRLCQCECGAAGQSARLRGPMALWALLVTRGLTARLEAGTVPAGEGFGGAPTATVLTELHRRIEERRSAGLDVDRFALSVAPPPPAVPSPVTTTVDPLAAPLLHQE